MLDPLCLNGIPSELTIGGWGHPSCSNTDHLNIIFQKKNHALFYYTQVLAIVVLE